MPYLSLFWSLLSLIILLCHTLTTVAPASENYLCAEGPEVHRLFTEIKHRSHQIRLH